LGLIRTKDHCHVSEVLVETCDPLLVFPGGGLKQHDDVALSPADRKYGSTDTSVGLEAR